MAEISRLHNALHESGLNLFELIKNLLEWAQIQRGAIPFNPRALEIEPILATNLMLYRNMAFEKNILLSSVNIPNTHILTDPNMIDTVLRNLIQNALKFTHPDGSVVVSAHTDHEWMWIQIKDTGIGISKERIQNIFKLDTTFSTLGTEGEFGSGLGLHVCNELVKNCGGVLEVISQEGVGTSFKLSIPLA